MNPEANNSPLSTSSDSELRRDDRQPAEVVANGELNGNGQLRDFFEKMKLEKERLDTFKPGKWPHSFIEPRELAKAGFFFLLNSDRVQCAFCRGVICNWEQGDLPLMEHMRHYPRCPFLLEYNVGNVPIDEDPIRGRNGGRVGRDVCGNHTRSQPETRINVEDKKNKVYSLPMSLNLRELGVRPHHGAKTIQYISYEARLNSYTNWPQTANVKPEKLADAGFFYIGIGDYVKCYYCDGGLCHWVPDDDPWEQHSRWFPDCGYVLLNKGYPYVESCRQKFGDSIANSSSAEDDALAVKAINDWFQSDIVKQLLNIHNYPVDVVKAALHRRWIEKQVPFEHLGDLNDAVMKCFTDKGSVMSRTLQRMRTYFSVMRNLTPIVKNGGGNLCVNGNGNGNSEGSQLSSSPESTSPLESYESTPSTSSSQSNGEREERLRCKICLDREVGVLFLPCGHVVTCTQCAPGISNCPICRKTIKGIVRTFFS